MARCLILIYTFYFYTMELKIPELKDKEVWSKAFVNIVSFHYETH